MKKIVFIVNLLAFVFSSCTSTFNIIAKTAYRDVENVSQVGMKQYIYNKVQTGTKVTQSIHKRAVTSTINKVSYETEYDGDIVAHIHLEDGHIVTVSVINGMMNSPQFLYGKEMKYYEDYWKYDTTYLYEYQRTTTIVKNDKIVSITIDTISDLATDYISFETPLYDTTVTRIVDDAKSKTDVKCIGKRIKNETYQLKLCRIEYNVNNMPHAVSKWVNIDKETYDKIYILEQEFMLVSDFDRFYDSRNHYLPTSCVSHLHNTEKTQIIIKTQD